MAEPGRAKIQKAREDNEPGRTTDPFDAVALAARLEEARARRARVLESRETGQSATLDDGATPRLQARKPSSVVISPQRFTPNSPAAPAIEPLVAPPKPRPAGVATKKPLNRRILVALVAACGVFLVFGAIVTTAPSVIRQKIAILIAPELGSGPSAVLNEDVALTVVPEPAPAIDPGASASGPTTSAPAAVRRSAIAAPLAPSASSALGEIAVRVVSEAPPIPVTEDVAPPSLPPSPAVPGPVPAFRAEVIGNSPTVLPVADDLRIGATDDPAGSVPPPVTPPLSVAALADRSLPAPPRPQEIVAPVYEQLSAATLAPRVPQTANQPAPEEATAAIDPATTRVIVHFPPSSGGLANAAVASISAGGMERVNAQPVGFSISQTNVRYFHAEDLSLAQAVVAAIGQSGDADAEVRDFTDFTPLPEPGLIEVWIAGTAPQAQTTRPQVASSQPATVSAAPETRLSRAEERELLAQQVEQMLRGTLQQLQQE